MRIIIVQLTTIFLAMTSLDLAPPGVTLQINHVRPSFEMTDCDSQLQQLGFLPGEEVVVQRHALPGHDPIVVRIGVSTFALRKIEAACIFVDLKTDAT